jgi:hypothetical protein
LIDPDAGIRKSEAVTAGLLRARSPLGLALGAALAVLAAAPPPARAQPAPNAKEAARQLAQEGFDLLEAGRYAEALAKLQEAEARFHAPSNLDVLGRVLEKLGRLLEARDTYRRVAAEDLGARAPKAFKEAQAHARRSLDDLKNRIPVLMVGILGAPIEKVHVTLDGRPVDTDALRQPIELDPRAYTLHIEAEGMVSETRPVLLKEGTTERLDLILQTAPRFVERPGSIVPGATLIGVGAAGLVVGAITGGLSLAKVGELRTACHGGFCPTSEAGTIDDAKTLGTVSTVGFVAGGVLAAAGIVLVIVRPGGSREAAPAPAAAIEVGPRSFVVRGRF